VLIILCDHVVVRNVVQTLPEGGSVRGLTSLDDHLYVLRGNKSSNQIEVYDIDSFRLLRYITVPRLGTTSDIVACVHYNCAYISDSGGQSVRRVALPDAAIKGWPVSDVPCCLSVTDKYDVLVTCHKVRKIKEFTTDGQLLRHVVLPEDVLSPWQTVQLSSGELIVCHGNPGSSLRRASLISSDGQVVKSYGGPERSCNQQMYSPGHMAVDENESFFVADHSNDRVLLLSPTLTYVREVMSPEQNYWKPFRLSVDVKRRRLYVAQNKQISGRVVVVNV